MGEFLDATNYYLRNIFLIYNIDNCYKQSIKTKRINFIMSQLFWYATTSRYDIFIPIFFHTQTERFTLFFSH